jgi:hypothetical protein
MINIIKEEYYDFSFTCFATCYGLERHAGADDLGEAIRSLIVEPYVFL